MFFSNCANEIIEKIAVFLIRTSSNIVIKNIIVFLVEYFFGAFFRFLNFVEDCD
jgi:hypothetical protein